MYHYYHEMHCKLTNVFIRAADDIYEEALERQSSKKAKKAPVEPDSEEICGCTHLLLEDEADAGLILMDAWNMHRFGKDWKKVPDEDREMPPIGIEAAIMLAPEIETGPLNSYVNGLCTCDEAITGCLIGTFISAFSMLGPDRKGERVGDIKMPTEEEVIARCKELDRVN